MDLNQKKKELKGNLPIEGITYVIKSLKQLLPVQSQKYNSLINIESDYNDIQLSKVDGILTYEEAVKVTAKIRQRLMGLIDGLQMEDFERSIQNGKVTNKPTYKRGSVLYKIPKKMQVFKETQCRVRIRFDEEHLLEGLVMDDDTIIKSSIRVSDRMKVEIIDPKNDAFDIRSTGLLEQLVDNDDFTEWRFYVKPLMAGRHILELKVYIIVIKDGIETIREKTLEESVIIIAEEVEEEELAFIKTMEDMVIADPKNNITLNTIPKDKMKTTDLHQIFTKRYAFLIGINDYQSPIPSLRTPINDVKAIANVLRNSPHNYTCLLYTSPSPRDRG